MIKKLNDKFGNEECVTVTKAMVATALDPSCKSLKSLDYAQREQVKDEVVNFKMVKMSMDAGVNEVGVDGPPSKRVRLSQSSSSSSDAASVNKSVLSQTRVCGNKLFSIDANNIGGGGSMHPNSM